MNCENCLGEEKYILQNLSFCEKTVKGKNKPIKRKTLFGEKIIGYEKEPDLSFSLINDEICYCTKCAAVLIKDSTNKSGTRVAKLADLYSRLYLMKKAMNGESVSFEGIDLGALISGTVEGMQAIQEAGKQVEQVKKNLRNTTKKPEDDGAIRII